MLDLKEGWRSWCHSASRRRGRSGAQTLPGGELAYAWCVRLDNEAQAPRPFVKRPQIIDGTRPRWLGQRQTVYHHAIAIRARAVSTWAIFVGV